MKNAVILIGLFCVCVAAEEPDPVEKALDHTIDGCTKSLGASKETLKLVAEGKGLDKVEVRCFNACMVKSAGLMKNGKLDLDKMGEMMKSVDNPNEEQIDAIISVLKECKDEAEVTEDECEVAGNYGKCVIAKHEAMEPKK